MKKNVLPVFFTFILLFFFDPSLLAQCFEPEPPGTGPQAVANAPVFCDVWELDGYCGSTYNSGVGICPGPFCGSCENYQWFAFMAPGPEVIFALQTNNCVGTANGSGMQAQVFKVLDDNNFIAASNCWSPGMEDYGLVTASDLETGEFYYLMIDGWAGDACDYVLYVVAADSTYSLGTPGPVEGETLTAEGAIVSYTTEELPTAGAYTWTISPPEAGLVLEGQGSSEIAVNWQQQGMAELCVQVSNACEETELSCLSVLVNEGLSVSYGSEPPACAGGSDGLAWVEALSGNPPFSYLWSTGDTLASINNLPEGEYFVTITDSLGFAQVISFTLEVPNPLQLVLQPDCEDFASLIGMPEGGTPPYTYAWNTGNSEPVQGDLQSGIYSLQITDSLGCQTEASFEVQEEAFTPFVADVEDPIPSVVCVDEPVLFAAQFAGPNAHYLWTFNPGANVGMTIQESVFLIPMQTGLHYAHLEVEKYGCTDDFAVYFMVTDDPEWCLLGELPVPGPLPGGDDEFADEGDAVSQRSEAVGDEEPVFLGLSPNPIAAGDVLSLRFEATTGNPMHLRVLASSGQRLYERELPAGVESWTVQLTDWPAGIYHLLLLNENGLERLSKNFVVVP